MKYPAHTTDSKPVTGEQAKKQLAAIEKGEGLITEKGKQLAERLLTRRRLRENDETQNQQIREH